MEEPIKVTFEYYDYILELDGLELKKWRENLLSLVLNNKTINPFDLHSVNYKKKEKRDDKKA